MVRVDIPVQIRQNLLGRLILRNVSWIERSPMWLRRVLGRVLIWCTKIKVGSGRWARCRWRSAEARA